MTTKIHQLALIIIFTTCLNCQFFNNRSFLEAITFSVIHAQFPGGRPLPKDRKFNSTIIEEVISNVTS